MKRFLLKVFLLSKMLIFTCISTTLLAGIVYRQAATGDIEQMLALYDYIEREDSEAADRLLLFPVEVRRDILLASLAKGRFFIAVNTEANQIVGFIKLFIVEDPAEVREIKQQELRIKADGDGGKLLEAFKYSFTASDIGRFDKALMPVSLTGDEEFDPFYSEESSCISVYYGGAFTHPSFRSGCCEGEHVNTQLMLNAFNSLVPKAKRLKDAGSGCCELLYGQVEANKNQRGIVKTFALFITQIEEGVRDLSLSCYAYEAYKPAFLFEKGELKMLPDLPKNRGQGNMVTVKLR